MTIRTGLFEYGFRAAALVDTGKCRTSNQDEVIRCPELGFYAVSDGMGGLPYGGKTSQLIKETLPGMVKGISKTWLKEASADRAASLLASEIRSLSDTLSCEGNRDGWMGYGATLSCVWLVGHHAIFVNLGDSRGYLLPRCKKTIRQITRDHNIAAMLVEQGEITREEARNHPASASLTHFVGMPAPALPEIFVTQAGPGDRILLCSDGLHGMVEDPLLPRLLRSSKSPGRVVQRLTDEANRAGGKDNIAVIYITILKP